MLNMMRKLTSLDQVPTLQIGRVSGFATTNRKLVEKLREIGFAEGDEIEVLQRGFLGGSPLSVRLNRSLIALRKNEAAAIKVDLDL